MAEHASGGIGHELRLVGWRGWQVWRLIGKGHKVALLGATLLMALTSAANTAMPLLLGRLVDGVRRGVQDGMPSHGIYATAAMGLTLIGVAYAVREALGVLRRYLVENTCTRVDRDLTVRLVSHMLRVDLSTLTHERVGTLHGRLSRGVDAFVRFLRLTFLDFFPAVMTGSFALIATTGKQPWLGLVMVGVIPASVALTLWQLRSQRNVRLGLLRVREQMDGMVVEQLCGLDYLRAANAQDDETRRVARSAEKRRSRELRHHLKMSFFGSGKALNEGLFHVLVLALAVVLTVRGRTSLGDILTFSFLFQSVMTPLAEIHRLIDEGHESSLRIADVLALLGEPVDRSFARSQVREPDLSCAGPLIRVEGLRVDHAQPNGTERSALDGIDLTIHRGETIGMAGRSGAGKTTCLRVLLGLTHATAGRVFIGGVPLEEVSREAIARLFGYVGQSPFVFAGTIAENIAYGVKNANSADIRRAAEKAGIHDEIICLPGGYDAPVAERGQNLSGGQRQRLALARVFLQNPPIVILDEATSALDNISERHVQRALAAARKDRTVIVVAHRLSTLLDADRIVVFDRGRIVEDAPYDELVATNGVFCELLRHSQGTAAHRPFGNAARAGARLHPPVMHSPAHAEAVGLPWHGPRNGLQSRHTMAAGRAPSRLPGLAAGSSRTRRSQQ